MRLTAAQHDELIAHAREDAPNECCGIVTLRDGVVEEVVRGENKRNSPYGYELDDASLMRLAFLEDEGLSPGVYHSHPRSPAQPSQTDINLAAYDNALYLIVSLMDAPEVRAWRIADGKVEEEDVVVA